MVSVSLLAFVADSSVLAGVIGGGGDHFGGYGMSEDLHSSGDYGGHMAFDDGGHGGFDNDIFESSGEHFGGDYGGGHGGFEHGGFNGGHGSGMSHEDNAALSAVGLANLLSGGGIGGAHAHMASHGGSSYTISGPTQEIKSIHKISTTSTGGHVIGRTKGASAEAPKFILVKSDSYLGGHGGDAGYSGGHGGEAGYSGGHGGYSGGHGGYASGHSESSGAHTGSAGGQVDLSGGHGSHGEHEELSSGHEGHGEHVELSSAHGASSGAHGHFLMGNSLGYGTSYGDAKTEEGWRKA